MIVTINGCQGKKNQSVRLIAAYSALLALSTKEKTLILQFIKPDIDCVETMYRPAPEEGGLFDLKKADISEVGMDALMSAAEIQKLTKQDFDALTTPMMNSENTLDVATVSADRGFINTAAISPEKIEAIIKAAEDVYNNIIILAPPYFENHGEKHDLAKFLNELAEVSIYCIRQGHKPSKAFNLYGKKIFFVLTDYESKSTFTLPKTKKLYKKTLKGQKFTMFKLSHCTAFTDSIFLGSLLSFIHKTRSVSSDDINYGWIKDLTQIIEATTKDKLPDAEKEDWDGSFERVFITEEMRKNAE